jgi:hypothetical protein
MKEISYIKRNKGRLYGWVTSSLETALKNTLLKEIYKGLEGEVEDVSSH